jgi:hypothetical protein
MVNAGLSSIGVLILTSVHHVYGALVYHTPWRMHIAFVAVPGIVILAGALLVFRKQRGTRIGEIALWIFAVVAVVFPIGWIGLFEGGYNHVVKDVLFFAGTSDTLMQRLFPSPLYEMPNDVLFEVTGVTQFPLALWAAYETYRLVRTARKTSGGPA